MRRSSYAHITFSTEFTEHKYNVIANLEIVLSSRRSDGLNHSRPFVTEYKRKRVPPKFSRHGGDITLTQSARMNTYANLAGAGWQKFQSFYTYLPKLANNHTMTAHCRHLQKRFADLFL